MTQDVPTGKNLILSASFEKESIEPDHAAGTLSLYHGDDKVGEAQIRIQLGACVDRRRRPVRRPPGGRLLTDDYPGEAPHRFTGGTINRVAIDVSGEPYIDLEREAQLMLMRE